MKAMSLMINDFVRHDKLKYQGKYKIVAIASPSIRHDLRFDGKYVITLYDEKTGYFSVNEDEIDPVPLNHKILSSILEYENKTEDGRYYSIKDNTIWGILDENKFYLNFNGQQDMIEIKYLHELQNAMRVAGLNELADNVEIN